MYFILPIVPLLSNRTCVFNFVECLASFLEFFVHQEKISHSGKLSCILPN